MSGEALELVCLVPIDAEVMELHLRLGPGQRDRAVERADVVGPVDDVEQLFPGIGDQGPEVDVRGCARLEADPPAQHEDRVEDSSGRP